MNLVKTERGRGGGSKESVIAMYWTFICGLLTYSKLNMVTSTDKLYSQKFSQLKTFAVLPPSRLQHIMIAFLSLCYASMLQIILAKQLNYAQLLLYYAQNVCNN